jgi:hypothetical protein
MYANPLKAPYAHASAWKGSDLTKSKEWVLALDDPDNDELQAALAYARRRKIGIPALAAESFPLPNLGKRLAAVKHDLIHGLGFSLLRGFDINRYELKDAALIYWGIGAHIGIHGAQNAQGDLLGHVTDLGVDYSKDANVRGYQTRLKLPFHNDAMDVVSLMCVQPAMKGGLSRVVSSTAIHNEVMARRPDLLNVLYEDFYIDRRGEAPVGKKPYYAGPMFSLLNDRLFCRYNRSYIDSAQRFDDVPRLTPLQVEALDLIDQLCNDPDLHLDMSFEPGDMQFLCNYTVLHSRTDYEDYPDKERRRYLLRLWLDTGILDRLPESFEDRFEDMKLWQTNPRPPIFDLTPVRAELAH